MIDYTNINTTEKKLNFIREVLIFTQEYLTNKYLEKPEYKSIQPFEDILYELKTSIESSELTIIECELDLDYKYMVDLKEFTDSINEFFEVTIGIITEVSEIFGDDFSLRFENEFK